MLALHEIIDPRRIYPAGNEAAANCEPLLARDYT